MSDEPLKADGIFEHEERKRDIEKLEKRAKELDVAVSNVQKMGIPVTVTGRKRIEMVQLLQRLKQAGESPGDVVLRALKFMDAQNDPMRRRPTGY